MPSPREDRSFWSGKMRRLLQSNQKLAIKPKVEGWEEAQRCFEASRFCAPWPLVSGSLRPLAAKDANRGGSEALL